GRVRFGRVQSRSLGYAYRAPGLPGHIETEDHQGCGYRDQNHGQCIFHEDPSGRYKATLCSRFSERTGTPKPTGTRRVAGKKSSRKIARKLTPIGNIPHSSPCQGAGTASDAILWAGGTSSFAHAVISPLPKVSIFRHPTKVSRGS